MSHRARLSGEKPATPPTIGTNANFLVASGKNRGCSAHLEVVVRIPAGNIPRILRVQLERTGSEVETIHVEQFRIAAVHGDQHEVRMPGIHSHNVSTDVLERRQVCRLARIDGGLVDVEVRVAVRVLGVDDVRAVRLPEVVVNTAFPVRRDHPIVGATRGSHPHVQHVFARRKVCESLPVR